MAIAISEPVAESTSTGNTSSYAMGAFTPTANALLVVLVFATGTVAATPTMTGGSLTWNRIGRITYNTTDSAVAFYAQVGASPASTTITFDCTGDAATGCAMAAFQVTGHNAAAPIAQSAFEQRTAANPTCTRSAANTNNGYIAGFGMPRNPPTSAPPGGGAWSETSDTGYNSPSAGMSTAYLAGGETSTTVTFTSASAAYGIAYVEVREASVAGPTQTITMSGIPAPNVAQTTVQDILGSDLYRWLLDYEISGGVATWTCEVGSGNATQATAANQPTAGTSTSGQTYPDYDGAAPANQDTLSHAVAITALPTYAATDHFAHGFAFIARSLPDGSNAMVVDINSGGGFNDGCIFITNSAGANHIYAGLTARSNSAVTDSTWRTFIAVHNGTTGVTTVYINGTAQTNTDTSAALGAAWKTSNISFGTQPVSTGRRFDGAIVSPFWAYRASASGVWDSTTIAALHTALAVYQSAAVQAFGSPTVANITSVEPTGVASDEAFGSPQLDLNVTPDAIVTEETFGGPTVSQTDNDQTVSPQSIYRYDPASLPLTGWWRDYAVAPWVGTASAGTSGSNDLLGPVAGLGAGAGPDPAAGAALNGYGTADGATDGNPDPFGFFVAEGTQDTYAASAAFSFWALVKLTTVADYQNVYFDALGGFVVSIFSSTVQVNINADVPVAERAISAGAWTLITARLDGTSLQVGVNEAPGAAGGASSQTVGAISDLTGGVQTVGTQGTFGLGDGYLDGLVAEIGVSDTSLSDADFERILEYATDRYALPFRTSVGSPTLVAAISPTGVPSDEALGSPTISPGSVDVTPTGITSDEAFGAPQLNLTVLPASVTSTEAFGTAAITTGAATITATGISSGETIGAPQLNLYVLPTGISSGAAFGSPTVSPGATSITPDGITSAESFGAPTLNPAIAPTGVTSGENLGSPTLTTGAVTVSPDGVVSAESFGAPQINLTVLPAGITSAGAFGTVAITTGAVTVALTAVASDEAFGTPQLNLNVLPTGIASGETFGEPILSGSGGGQSIRPDGITSGAAFGTPQINLYVLPTGITSLEAFGTPQLNLYVTPTALASAEALGSPTLLPGSVDVSLTGISSAESVGTLAITSGFTVIPSGIASDATFGSPTLTPGAVTVTPTGVSSGESFGSPTLHLYVLPTGIVSTESFGSPSVVSTISPTGITSEWALGSPTLHLQILPAGVASGGAFGSPTITTGAVTVSPTGIPSSEAFGEPFLSDGFQTVTLTGIASGEAFGSPTLTTGPVTITVTGITSAESFGSPAFFFTVTIADIRCTYRPSVAFRVSVNPSTSTSLRLRAETRITTRLAVSILHVGDTAQIDAEFRVDGTLTDPTTVSIEVRLRATGASTTTYTYGTDAEVSKTSTGKYRAMIDCDTAGTWDYVWVLPGPTAKGAEPGWFDVDELPF